MKKYDAFILPESATHIALLTDVHRCAFTLAEVLITLGIIGVVAALTMPSLIQNKQKKELETAFKKSYANFYNAYNKAKINELMEEQKSINESIENLKNSIKEYSSKIEQLDQIVEEENREIEIDNH